MFEAMRNHRKAFTIKEAEETGSRRTVIWEVIEADASRQRSAAHRRSQEGEMMPMSVTEDSNAKAGEVFAYKLFAPTRHLNAVRRKGIIDRVFSDTRFGAILLQGPAGHGKSTALQQLKCECEARGSLAAWLTFDEADNDLRRFSLHMHAVVASLRGEPEGHWKAESDEGSDLGRRRRADWMIDHLFKLGRPVAIFFDEFQALQDKVILRFFRGLLEKLPENVRVFIGSRTIPEIGLSRLVINEQALVLRSEDLRFSVAEVHQFFAASKSLAVTEEEIAAIYSRTEGWPAALHLFQHALVSPMVRRDLTRLDSYRPRELAEYLVDNVLNLLPLDIQHFLLHTSLLKRLCAPLCDAVTGIAHSQEMLEKIDRAGLFVSALDSDRRWFKYHPLFSSFMADQLRAQFPDRVIEAHRLAAAWHLAQGSLEDALHHFVAVHDFSAAADAMNVWATRLTAGAHLHMVEHWYDHLPFEEVAKRPDLAIKVAYCLVFLRRQQKLKPLLQVLQRYRGVGDVEKTANPDLVLSMAALCSDDVTGAFAIIEGVPMLGSEIASFAAFELSAGSNLLGYRDLASGDLPAARDHLAQACAYCNRGNAAFSGGYTIGLLGVHLMMQGQLDASLERFRKGMSEQRMHLDGSFALAAMVSCYIWALYEANELDMVESLFAQYRDLIAEAVLLDFLAVAYVPMARTHDARGRPAQAMEILDEAESIGHANGWERLVRLVQWERVRRWLVSGAVERALALADRIPHVESSLSEGWRLFSDDVESEWFGRIRLAVHTMDGDTAASLLAREMSHQHERVNRQIKLHLLDALRLERKGSHSNALRRLRKALQLAQGGKFIRCFIDEGEQVLQLLREEYKTIIDGAAGRDAQFGGERAFIEQILRASGTDLNRAPVGAAPRVEDLTDREKEVLMFLADGFTNQELAGRVFVSTNTVKFHLRNIYTKLAVANRFQAIAIARNLGIVH
ncbi:MAG: LuxR C-terminal-related transcriptional regulator [Panacagrimonas sp.]